jgi:hypothetical protein
MRGLVPYAAVAVVAAALLWPGSPAGKAVASVTGALHQVLGQGAGVVTGGMA